MGYRYAWKYLFMQKFVGINRKVRWPVSFRTEISKWENISFHVDDMQIFWHFGCYFQNFSAHISVGEGSYIAPNVGIITANHNIVDLSKHEDGREVIIGNKCWIGMNSVILPGVVLGEGTVVGAGSVVTKSFPEGHCTIAGSPARVIKFNNKE